MPGFTVLPVRILAKDILGSGPKVLPLTTGNCLANDTGNVREVAETFRVGDGFLQNPPGNYLLSITAEGDSEGWTVQIDLIGAS